MNQKGYDIFETTVEKLSVGRIQICQDYLCLGIILKVIQADLDSPRRIL